MRIIVCAAALILAGNLLAQDNSPTNELYELKGDVLGMSLEEWIARRREEWTATGQEEQKYSWEKCGGNGVSDLTTYQRDPIGCRLLNTTVAGRDVYYIDYEFNVGDDPALNGLFRIRVQLRSGIEGSLDAFVIRGALVAKYGPPRGKRIPDPDDPDEPAALNVPADSWVSGESEILFENYQDQLFNITYIHWPLYREYRRRQTAKLLRDL